MSDDLNAQFSKAGEAVKTLSKEPDAGDKLTLYALFKQGTKGDCSGDRPGMMDFVGRAKYDAWKGLAGVSQDDAKQKYIQTVESMLSAEGRSL